MAEPTAELADYYPRAYQRLVGTLRVMGVPGQDAVEVAQEAFVWLIPRWEKVRGYQSPDGWLRTVAWRLWLNRSRSRGHLSSAPVPDLPAQDWLLHCIPRRSTMADPVEETDRALAALVREEAARTGDVPPPPLAELVARASARRRRRTALVALGAAAAVVGIVAWQGLSGDVRGAYVPPAGGPIRGTFPVPSYDWDGGSGMDALVSGTLGLTPEGCTMMSNGRGEDRVTQAVFFPNATGVTYDNGVRAVVDSEGNVFAIEGQEFSYGGGHVVERDSELGAQWLTQCPDTDLREGAVINDTAATDPLTEAPPVPDQPGPTAPTSDEELGWYEVPTFEWDPEQGGDAAQIEGRVLLSPAGCPLLHTDDGQVVALVFPNAEGREEPDRQAIWGTVGGTHGVFVEDGQQASFGGGHGARHQDWERLCGTSEPAPSSWFWVYQSP